MKVRELRIGNYVDYEKTSHIITGIDINGTITSKWKSDKDDEYYIHNVDSIEGIPLTPEILEKAGFSQHHDDCHNDVMYIKGIYGDLPFNWGAYPDDFGSGYRVRGSEPLSYLHQLQNLYFALTGEELNLQL